MNLSLSANLFLSTNNSGIGTRYNSPDLIADFSKDSYFVKGVSKSFNEVFEFNRASSSYYTDGNGLITEAVVDEPRLVNHIWENGELKPAGLAVCSEVRTNLVNDSRLMENAGNLTGGTSEVITTQVAPDGSFEVRRLTESISDIGRSISLNGAEAPTPGFVYTISVFIRPNPATASNRYICFRGFGVGGGGQFPVWDLSTLEIVRGATDNWSNATSSYVGNGWYRISATLTPLNGTPPIIHLSDDANPTGSPAPYEGDGVSGCMIWGYQLEQSAFVTDYIETDAAPVSTASETLQIDPVELAKAVGVFGPELVVNSDGSDGTTGWYGRHAGDSYADIISSGNGRLRSTLAPTSGNPAIIQKIEGLVIGQTYSISGFAHLSPEASGGYFRASELYELGNGTPFQKYISDGDEVDELFVATATTMYLGVVALTGTVGGYAEIEALSVKSVTMPTHLGLAIEGYMTYEDDNGPVPVRPCTWELDAGNRIAIALSIEGAETGRMWFNTTSEGVSSSISSAIDAYSPGVNVYFSVASRLEVGDFNAAHEGSILSAAATVAIPNLMGSAFQLATLGNMNLTKVLLWSSPLEDDNLVEITS